MAVSSVRVDPASPASVAEASFSSSRRGYDTAEVREALRAVAAELGRLQERERFLERELRLAQETQPAAPVLDDETVAQLLGEETLRVLQTARESASQIRAKAEESAAAILRDAADEASRIRADAEIDIARRRAESTDEAEAELALAKQQGREMVNEARAYRERVLGELAKRREAARLQIEQLIIGRDRLLQVFDRARTVAVDVVAELTPLTGPLDDLDLTATTGPVPTIEPDPAPAEPVVGEGADALGDAAAAESTVVEDSVVEDTVVEDTVDDPAAEVAVVADGVEEPVGGEPAESPVDDDTTEPGSEPAADNVVALFARLRAETGSDVDDAPVGDTADAAVEDSPAAELADETAFARRDAALTPLIVAAARKLKRVLADEQNDVLDLLRRREPVTTLDALLPDYDEHVARFTDAIGDELAAAAAAGAAEIDPPAPATADRTAVVLADTRGAFGTDLVTPLRTRLERAVSDGGGDNDDVARRVRAVYREWKTQHIDVQLDDLLRAAHGGGLLAAIEPGTPVEWTVDPSEPGCPDCDDNALAGAVAAGEAFPTGHRVAPAHPGCRCLLAPTDR